MKKPKQVKIRRSWGNTKPATRVEGSGKKYNRKKIKVFKFYDMRELD